MYVWCFLQKRNFIFFHEFLLSLTGLHLHHGNLASKKFAFAVRTIVFSCQVPISNNNEGESLLSSPLPTHPSGDVNCERLLTLYHPCPLI